MTIDVNQQVIDEFRAQHGRVGGPFAQSRLILLTTTGARTGVPHTVPVGFLHDGEGRMLVIASAGGAPRHPAWYHNLRAHPRVTVETGAFTLEADAVMLDGQERDGVFARAVESDPGWAEYQVRAGRTLPVIALEPVDGAPNEAGGWGNELKLVHDAFRRELAIVRNEIAESGTTLGAQLRINCLMICQGLHHHHASEDDQLLPALDQEHPELAPVLARLRQEHVEIARLLDELQATVSAEPAPPAALLGRVEQLTAELQAHLAYEEEHLIPILNAATPRPEVDES